MFNKYKFTLYLCFFQWITIKHSSRNCHTQFLLSSSSTKTERIMRLLIFHLSVIYIICSSHNYMLVICLSKDIIITIWLNHKISSIPSTFFAFKNLFNKIISSSCFFFTYICMFICLHCTVVQLIIYPTIY